MAEKTEIMGMVRPPLTFGKFILFKSKWLAWIGSQEGPSQSNNVETSLNNGETSSNDVQPPPSEVLTNPLVSNNTSLISILKATAPGRRLMRDYKVKLLTGSERNLLLDLVAQYFLNHELHLCQKTARQLVQQIKDIFSQEDVVTIIPFITYGMFCIICIIHNSLGVLWRPQRQKQII